MAPTAKRSSQPLAYVILAVLALIAVSVLFSVANPDPPLDPLDRARYACEEFVRRSLHDPDSAKLTRASEWQAWHEQGAIVVRSTGRAKNAFGAYVYGAWDCRIHVADNGDARLLVLEQIAPDFSR